MSINVLGKGFQKCLYGMWFKNTMLFVARCKLEMLRRLFSFLSKSIITEANRRKKITSGHLQTWAFLLLFGNSYRYLAECKRGNLHLWEIWEIWKICVFCNISWNIMPVFFCSYWATAANWMTTSLHKLSRRPSENVFAPAAANFLLDWLWAARNKQKVVRVVVKHEQGGKNLSRNIRVSVYRRQTEVG